MPVEATPPPRLALWHRVHLTHRVRSDDRPMPDPVADGPEPALAAEDRRDVARPVVVLVMVVDVEDGHLDRRVRKLGKHRSTSSTRFAAGDTNSRRWQCTVHDPDGERVVEQRHQGDAQHPERPAHDGSGDHQQGEEQEVRGPRCRRGRCWRRARREARASARRSMRRESSGLCARISSPPSSRWGSLRTTANAKASMSPEPGCRRGPRAPPAARQRAAACPFTCDPIPPDPRLP